MSVKSTEPFLRRGHRAALPPPLAVGHLLGKGLRIRHYIAQGRVNGPSVKHFGAHNLRRGVDLSVFYGLLL